MLEKTKRKLEVTFFYQNDFILNILKVFPLRRHRRHLMFPLPIE